MRDRPGYIRHKITREIRTERGVGDNEASDSRPEAENGTRSRRCCRRRVGEVFAAHAECDDKNDEDRNPRDAFVPVEHFIPAK